MMSDMNNYLIPLLGAVLFDRELEGEEIDAYTEDRVREVMRLAKRHDVSHLAATALDKYRIRAMDAGLQREIMVAVYRYAGINHDLEGICRALEAAGIPFIPLKGSVIRRYYKEPWMRTSCDIDILVKSSDVEAARAYLSEKLGLSDEGKTSHDVSMHTPGKTHLELHYNLIEDGVANASAQVLSTVWDTAVLKEGYNYYYEMTDDVFYFYHVAHMAKHFGNGGCGIRPFIDLHILDTLPGVDLKKRKQLIDKGGLCRFEAAAVELSRYWFAKGEPSPLTHKMESYILFGGVYGNMENNIAVKQNRTGGKGGYIMSRIFMPYDKLKLYYPVIIKHKWLTPFIQVRRWLKLLNPKRAGRAAREVAVNNNIDKSQAREMNEFLLELGL